MIVALPVGALLTPQFGVPSQRILSLKGRPEVEVSFSRSALWSTKVGTSSLANATDGLLLEEIGESTLDMPYFVATQDSAALAPPDTLTLWKRRLITHEDPFSIHKLSSLAYSLSSIIILGTGLVRFFNPDRTVFAEIPASLELPAMVFVISNALMCFASVRMAFEHRKFDLTARNAFLGTAVSSLFSGFYFLWTSPFEAGNVFNNQIVNQSFFGVLVVLNLVFIMDTLLQVPQVVESRRDKKAEKAQLELERQRNLEVSGNSLDGVGLSIDTDVTKLPDVSGRQFIIDALGYVLPIAWGMPAVASTGYIASVLHDRPWFLDQCLYIDQMTGQSGLNANICYLQVFTSLAASYGSLFVTLRDKKLISKKQELVGITAFSVPAMIWTVYVTIVFFLYLFDTH